MKYFACSNSDLFDNLYNFLDVRSQEYYKNMVDIFTRTFSIDIDSFDNDMLEFFNTLDIGTIENPLDQNGKLLFTTALNVMVNKLVSDFGIDEYEYSNYISICDEYNTSGISLSYIIVELMQDRNSELADKYLSLPFIYHGKRPSLI